MGRGMGISRRLLSGLEDDLHAVVLLVLERLVGVRRHVQPEAVGDHEARVDLALADALVERLEVAVDGALAGLDRQALVHQRAGRELVHEPAVDADDRHDAARAAGHDRVAQGVAAVGERDARVLGLAAGVAAGDVRVAEDAARRVAEELLGEPRVRVGVLAHRVELVLAGPAVAAGDRERHDDAVARLQVGDAAPGLDHLPHELVAEDVALLRRRDVAVVEVEVRAADRRRRDPDDRIALVEDRRVRDVLDLDGVAARPDGGPHDTPAFSSSAWSSGCAGRCLSLRSASSPSGEPSERGMTPVSTRCLKRRRSSLIFASCAGPFSFCTAPPSPPPPAAARSTWISVPRSPGAGLKVTAAPDSATCSARYSGLFQSRCTSSRARWTVMAACVVIRMLSCSGGVAYWRRARAARPAPWRTAW